MRKKNHFLLWLILIVLLKNIIWSLFMPLWHFPDEQAHFAQISVFVETGKMLPHPDLLEKDLSQELFLSEDLLGTNRDWAGNNRFTYHPEYNLEYTSTTVGKYEKEIAHQPIVNRRLFVKKEGASYPPLYYILSSLPYRLVYFSDLFVRVFTTRVFNVLFSILLILICYKLFLIIFGKSILLVQTATILVAFQPMLTFVSSGINSDNLFNLLFAAGMYLSFSLVFRNDRCVKKILLMACLLFISVKTKPQGLLLLYIYMVPLSVRVYQSKYRWRWISLVLVTFILLTIKILPIIFSDHQLLPDVPRTYERLPNLSYWDHLFWSLKHTYREVLPWYFGVFRWLSLVLPAPVRRIIHSFIYLSVVGNIVFFLRLVKEKDFKRLRIFLFMIFVSIGYFFILNFWDFLFTRGNGFSLGFQGRYFFPVLPIHMAILLWGLTAFTKLSWLRRHIAKTLGFGMILLNAIALYVVLSSYYDAGNIGRFFLQASQYKPWFAKSSYLEAILAAYSFALVFFVIRVIMKRKPSL